VAVKLGYKNVFREPRGYPEWQKMGFPVESIDVQPSTVKESETPGPLYGWGMIWTLLGIFAGGIALNLTPCVYPLIPITVSYFGGRGTRGQLVIHGLCYILGIAFTNSLLGVAAALTGGLMGAMLQHPIVIITVASVLIVFATSLFGFWELRLPSGLTQFAAASYTGWFGSLFMGLTMGVIAAPCIGPFVLGLLTWVASMASPWLGFIVFFTLSLGLGLPLFFLAIFSGKIEKLPRSGEWMLWVRKLMGWVLISMAAYFIRSVLPETYGVILLALTFLIAGLYLGWIDKTQAGFRAFAWIKPITGAVGIIAGVWMIGAWMAAGPGVQWQPYSDKTISEAKASQKPVIIDFYANWCTPCRELEKVTFHNSEVVKAANAFVMIKADLTRSGNPVYERLLKHYAIKGVPTIVFIDSQGKERTDLRLVDFMPPDQFVQHISKLRH
jgi:thiol:disulfide interchange protein DsbD